MTSIRVRIDSVSGCSEPLDAEELGARVAAELAELLARMPLASPPPPGSVVQAPGGRVHTGSTVTAASVAHAIARLVYIALQSAAPCR